MPIPIPLKFVKVGYKYNDGFWTVVNIDKEGIHSEVRKTGYPNVPKCIMKWDGETQIIYINPNENPEFDRNDEGYKKWHESYSDLVREWLKTYEEERLAYEKKVKQRGADFNKAVSEI